MIPLRDNIPSRTTPIVNYALIAACSLVFALQLVESESPGLVERFGMIPARLTDSDRPIETRERVVVRTPVGLQIRDIVRETPPSTFSPWWTLLTCIFLHGGWLHVVGNMWFLYIFGDNVEDRCGHVGYLLLYFASGIAASLAHLATNVDSTVPTIGASGAIAGVMGAYMLLYPHAMVLTLVPIVFILEIVVLPAYVFLAVWFVMQFFQGTLSIVATEAGGVAWWAHIGGFVAGLLLVRLFRKSGRLRPGVELRLPNAERFGHYRFRAQRHW